MANRDQASTLISMFPERYSVLILSPPEAGAFEFCTYLASFYLRSNQSVLMVETDTSRALIWRQLRSYGVSQEEPIGERFTVIDCFSEPAAVEPPDMICDPGDLSALLASMEMATNRMSEPVRIIFDSISSLHMYSEPEEVHAFLGELTNLARKRGSLTATFHNRMSSPEQIDSLVHLCDGLIEMKVDENMRRYIRISKMQSIDIEPAWIPFEVDQAYLSGGTALLWKRDEEEE